MSGVTARGLDQIRSDYPQTYEALQDIVNAVNQIGVVTGCGPVGPATTPANNGQMSVVAADGIFDIALMDPNPQRGEFYFAEHSINGTFNDAIVHPMGASRNLRVSLGNLATTWRYYKQLPGSNPSPHIYFGGSTPKVVVGGGVNGPPQQSTQGSGTSKIPGHGFGPIGPNTGV